MLTLAKTIVNNLDNNKITSKWRLLSLALLHHFKLYPTLSNFSYKLLLLKFMEMERWNWINFIAFDVSCHF